MLLDVNKQRVDSEIVELFELYLGSTVRFTNYPTSVTFGGNLYTAIPLYFSGYAQKAEGAYSRPTITFANILATFKNAINTTNDDLIGKKIIRRKTLAKYLTSNPTIEMPKEVFIIDRIEAETVQSITFELTAGFDLQGISVPNRYILANTCTWLYQGVDRSSLGGCTWKRTNDNPGFEVLFDANNRPLITPGANAIPDMPTTGQPVVENYIYKVAKSPSYDYYQAVVSFTKTNSFETTNFRRCRIIQGNWNSANSYTITTLGKLYNPLVKYDNKIWVAITSSQNIVPGTNEFYWERVDTCGKKLSSCVIRYKAKQVSPQGFSVPDATKQDDNIVLPYGGFPGAKRFNR